jgi:cytochrome c553
MRKFFTHITATLAVASGLLTPLSGSADDAGAVAVCAGCHGAAGHSAVADNPILAGQSAEYLKSALNGYLDGSRDYGIMKTMVARLSPASIDAITRYYAAQAPAQSQARFSMGDAQRGAQKIGTCAACHGADGKAVMPLYPNLAGQHAKYLSKSLAAYRGGSRTHAVMTAMVTTLSDEDIADVAAYYAAQPVANSTGSTASSGGY